MTYASGIKFVTRNQILGTVEIRAKTFASDIFKKTVDMVDDQELIFCLRRWPIP